MHSNDKFRDKKIIISEDAPGRKDYELQNPPCIYYEYVLEKSILLGRVSLLRLSTIRALAINNPRKKDGALQEQDIFIVSSCDTHLGYFLLR